MKALKITAILLLVILAMRLASWAVAWAIRKAGIKARSAAVIANAACFVAFAGWLYSDLLQGEPMDWAAVLFGAVVFGGCAALDLMRIRRRARMSVAAAQ